MPRNRRRQRAEERRNDVALSDAPSASADETASITRNALLALLTQLTTGVFTAGVTLYLVRVLGPGSFGVFALATGLGEIALLIADFGIPWSTSRFLAEKRNDRTAVAALLADALRLKLITAALVAGGFFLAATPIADAYGKPALVWPLRAVAVAVFGQSIMALYASAFIGLARIGVNLRVTFLESLVETAATVGLVMAGTGVIGATFGRSIGYLFGALVAIAVVARLLGGDAFRWRGRRDGQTAEIARYAVPLLVTNSAYSLYAQVDVLIIGAMLGTTAVGLFSAPLAIVIPLSYVGQAVANAVAPRQTRGREQPRVGALQASLRWMLIYQSLLLAPIIIWAGPIVRLLLGPEFHGSTNVFRFLALFIFLRGLGPLITTTVNYLGHAARRIPIVLSALGLNVVLDLVLLPRVGVVGAAIGTGIAYALYVSAHFRICRRELDLAFRQLALTSLRALLAAIGMGAVLFTAGTGTLSLTWWVLGGAGGVVVFAAVLLITGEVPKEELRRGRRAMSALLSRLAA